MEGIDVDESDLIVVGTGLVESLIASSAAKAKKTVLNVDPAAHYGSQWASLSLQDLLDWADLQSRPAANGVAYPEASPASTGSSTGALREVAVHMEGPSPLYWGVEVLRGCSTEQLGPSRDFNIDLAPKVAYCAGPLVQALVRCSAQNYLEFKLVQGSYVYRDGRLQPVPASRADVFRDRSLGPAEKRALMRFLQACTAAFQGGGELQEALSSEEPFVQLLRRQQLEPRLQESIMHAVCMLDGDQNADEAGPAGQEAGGPNTGAVEERAGEASPSPPLASCSEALAGMRQYVESAGRYGGTGAFMTPMYGVCEIVQAFCRVAAVNGATYMLRQPVVALLVDDATQLCTGVRLSTGQEIKCQQLAAHPDVLANLLSARAGRDRSISRAILVVDRPLQEGESQLMAVLPPHSLEGRNPAAVRVLQLGGATAVCPQDRYVLHFSTPGFGAPAKADLWAAVSALVRVDQLEGGSQDAASGTGGGGGALEGASGDALMDIRPRALLAVFYSQACGDFELAAGAPTNVACCSPPDGMVGFTAAMSQASELAAKLFPELGAGLFSSPEEEEAGAADDGDESDEEAVVALEAALHRLPNGIGPAQ